MKQAASISVVPLISPAACEWLGTVASRQLPVKETVAIVMAAWISLTRMQLLDNLLQTNPVLNPQISNPEM